MTPSQQPYPQEEIQELRRRIEELERRPVFVPYYPAPEPIPYYPTPFWQAPYPGTWGPTITCTTTTGCTVK